MSLYGELNQIIKDAMKSGDTEKKDFARSLKAKISIHVVDNRLDRSDVQDEVFLTVTAAHSKWLSKGATELEKGGKRAVDMVDQYRKEARFCDQFLPQSLSEDETLKIVQLAINELQATSPSQVGKVIGHVLKNNKDRPIVGNVVKKLVVQILK